jgi:hypothetical protein
VEFFWGLGEGLSINNAFSFVCGKFEEEWKVDQQWGKLNYFWTILHKHSIINKK